jgi:hypothetical protein
MEIMECKFYLTIYKAISDYRGIFTETKSFVYLGTEFILIPFNFFICNFHKTV